MNHTSLADSAESKQPSVAPAPRLLDQIRQRIRVKQYSIRTETAYLDWIKRYIRFFDKRCHDGQHA